jgi:rhodanese-related sulfurtransferase/mannose-6-phosphate isomerase-like protein (cupin superfamily)
MSLKLMDLVVFGYDDLVANDQTLAPVTLTPNTLVEIACGLALAANSWARDLGRRSSFRTGRRILATESYDVWLLRWPVGTPVRPHHHGDSDAAFAVAAGVLKETRWEEGRRVERFLDQGHSATVPRGVVHDVEAAGREAVSVHVYSPPLSRMAFFDPRGTTVVVEEPVDLLLDAFSEEELDAAGHPSGVDAMLHRARRRIDPRVDPQDLTAEVARGSLLVDIRPSDLRQRDGVIDGALVIDRNVLEWRLDPVGTHRLGEAADPQRRVIVVCDEGYASSLAAASLLDLGRSDVTDLKGGFQAWRRLVERAGMASR